MALARNGTGPTCRNRNRSQFCAGIVSRRPVFAVDAQGEEMLAKFSEKAGDIKDETLRKTVMETVRSAARALENIRSSAKAQELLADNSTVWAPRVPAPAGNAYLGRDLRHCGDVNRRLSITRRTGA